MSDIAIKVEDLGKLYRLGQVGTGTISHDLNRWWARMRGKEDPFAKIGETNDRTAKGTSDYVWSLKDINFEVKQGEVLGIIGRNGAGKSTLLKILSKVTAPTTGRIKIQGRIASLLEVGTGFHPELTGRENIFLNGAILGMTKAEIRSKFDEIVDFSGVERYIDTPVKRYSSGMYVRLAFAVSAFLEPEILIVDEVLAVGDAEFQKKCLGRMKDVSVNDGRTVLFVSHNMAAVKTLCEKGLVLSYGTNVYHGNQNEAINFYQNSGEVLNSEVHATSLYSALGNTNIRILKVNVTPQAGNLITVFSGINFNIQFYNFHEGKNIDVTLEVLNQDNILLFHNGGFITTNNDSKIGVYEMNCKLPKQFLNSGIYTVSLIFGENQRYILYKAEELIFFEVLHETSGSNSSKLPGLTLPKLEVVSSYKSPVYE
ncbi:ABC transporter ATP-binding protein [Adhaeribacter pallidiroseus]|uniref:ATP-binding cassette transporter abc3 n=1 Tax=Adhaeribacter pallidiroseus TaxID=2072847 RepID=A0A369QLK3_9BACT|nr:ABC transporter ATP-binding protein [Adhaeribacter pallidiroseus]RDC64127.1 ATP-binding cassette transporter abc3 [Adhaeribacter pallidiroseus]